MVREVKPLTSVVPVTQDGQTTRPASAQSAKRKGTLVLEVQDPEAIAALGEQLSLAHELMMPPAENASTPAARSRKTTTKSTAQKSTAQKSATGKTTTKRASSKTRTSSKIATTTKAKQKNGVEASLTVPIGAATEQQMLARVQQLESMIDNLQNRLTRLHQTDVASASPTSPPPTAMPQSSHPPRLPDWSEPELRPHYTLQESARIYEAIEALQQHRALQTAAGVEMAEAQALADRLRQPRDQIQASGAMPMSRRRAPITRQRVAPAPSATQQLAAQRKLIHRRGRRPARWRWDTHQFWRNLRQLVQQIILVPSAPGAKIVDGLVWVLATIGLRLVLNVVIQVIPVVAGPLNLLMAIPAILAAYLAFCVENSRSDTIYRLLLVTLGLFLGGRL